ncbi:MAG: DUF2298 domain-containing protein, partial [Thermomicrobiales bacterium]
IARPVGWRQVARDVLVVGAGALVVAAPFLLQFSAPVGVPSSSVPGWLVDIPLVGRFFNTFAFVSWRPSSVRELVIVHGAWLAVFAAFASIELLRDRSLIEMIRRRWQPWLTAGILAFGVAMAWAPAVLLLGLPLLLAVWLSVRAERQPVRALAGLFAAGFLLALIPEFFYIQDVFADRMNTVFKLFYQAWLLLSIASAGALVHAVGQTPRAARVPAVAAAAMLVLMTLPYAPLSAQDWTADFAERRGIDGRAYIGRNAPGDLAAIDWISQHSRDGDTIVEAPGCSYVNVAGAPMSRVSAFSGVPTLVGWHGHESQWRRGEDPAIGAVLDTRAERANAILNGAVPAVDSGARFVVLGSQETHESPDCDLTAQRGDVAGDALVAAGWELAFENAETRIYAQSDDPLVAHLR